MKNAIFYTGLNFVTVSLELIFFAENKFFTHMAIAGSFIVGILLLIGGWLVMRKEIVLRNSAIFTALTGGLILFGNLHGGTEMQELSRVFGIVVLAAGLLLTGIDYYTRNYPEVEDPKTI